MTYIMKKIQAYFNIMERIRGHEKRDNVKFILTARIPDYDRFIDPKNGRLYDIASANIRDAIRSFFYKVKKNEKLQLQYELRPFTKDEVKGFIEKYQYGASPEFKQES